MNHILRPTVAAALGACLLVACGGGGGSGSPDAGPASLTLSGTAATGAAIAGAPVSVKCAAGNGAATTQPDGTYTIEIVGGSLPCVIAVTPATGSALHSVIDVGAGTSVNVNITPLDLTLLRGRVGT